ncbi:hypothetical protein D3C77_630370 [compost metagenome]
MAQGIAEMKRRLKSEQCQTVPPRQTQVEQQGLLATALYHSRQMRGQQGTIGRRLRAIQYG